MSAVSFVEKVLSLLDCFKFSCNFHGIDHSRILTVELDHCNLMEALAGEDINMFACEKVSPLKPLCLQDIVIPIQYAEDENTVYSFCVPLNQLILTFL